jgi:hypothetical protein
MSIFWKLALVMRRIWWLIVAMQPPVVYLAKWSNIVEVNCVCGSMCSVLIFAFIAYLLFTVLAHISNMFITRHCAERPEDIHFRHLQSARVASIRTHIQAYARLCRTSLGISLVTVFSYIQGTMEVRSSTRTLWMAVPYLSLPDIGLSQHSLGFNRRWYYVMFVVSESVQKYVFRVSLIFPATRHSIIAPCTSVTAPWGVR